MRASPAAGAPPGRPEPRGRSTQALQPKDLGDKPTWKELPAVKAGQVVPWQPEPRFSYAGCAPILEEFAAALQSAKKAG